MLYHYFADGDALVEAAVARRCAQVQEALARLFAGMDSLTDLERRLDEFTIRYEQNLSGCPIGRIASEVGGRHEGAQRQAQMAFARWKELFTALFSRLRKRGDPHPGQGQDPPAGAGPGRHRVLHPAPRAAAQGDAAPHRAPSTLTSPASAR